MKKTAILSTSLLAMLLAGAHAQVPAKVTYNDHVLPIFRNACLNCHNPDKKKAGLDLSTYQAALAGSDNGKVVESGDAGKSLLFSCVKGTEEPKMPPKGDRLTDNELAVVEKWIAGQLLETASSKGVVAANNVQLAVVSLERPDGPPPMPGDLPLEPFVRSRADTALVALAASPWAPLVAVGGQKQVLLYNTETLQPLGILPFPEGFPAIVRFSRNGKLLLTGGGLGGKSGQVVLWDVQTGERAGTVGNEFDQVLGADLSPDQAHVALGGPTRVLKIYSTKDGKQEHSIKKHTDWITAVAYSPDGKYLASADRAGGIVVWEAGTGKEFNTLPGHKVMVTALAFMPGILASASQDGTVVLWDVKEAKEIRKWNAHKDGVEWVDFTPDGRVVTCGRDKVAKVWDSTGKNLFTSAALNDIALRAALSNDRLVAGDWTGAITVFTLKEPKGIGALTANPPPLAEQLAAAQKRADDAKAALAPLQQAVAAAEEKIRAEQTEPSANAASSPTDVEKKIAETAKKLEQQNAEVAKLREERSKQKEGSPEFASANEKVQAKKAEIAQTQAALETAGKRPASTPAPSGAQQELAKAKAALDEAQPKLAAAIAELARWQRAQSYMRVHTARQTLIDKTAKHEELLETAKDAFAPVEQLKSDIAAAEKVLAGMPAQLREKESLVTKAQAELDPLSKTIAATEQTITEKEAAIKIATESLAKAMADAAQLPKDLQKKEKEIAEAQKALDKLTTDIAKRRDERGKIKADAPEYAAADAKVQEMKPRLAEATTKLDGLKAEVTTLKTGAEAATAGKGQLEKQIQEFKAEIAKSKEALEQSRTTLKTAQATLAAAEKALTDARKNGEAASKRFADAKKKLPEAARTAQVTKATAEKQAALLAKELISAKSQAERAKAEFETKYRPVQQAAAQAEKSSAPAPKS